MGPTTLFYNCRVVSGLPDAAVSAIAEDWVLCSGGKVTSTGTGPGAPAADATVDCGGAFLAPGFIDLQFNGGWGKDFSDPASTDLPADIAAVRANLLATGVTSFLPTLISSSQQHYQRAVSVFKDILAAEATVPAAGAGTAAAPASAPAARIIGLHLEGPYMALEKRGAHPPENLRVPGATEAEHAALASLLHAYGPEVAEEVRGRTGLLRMVTLAPELEGSMPLSRALAASGVVVAVGHTAAPTALLEKAFAPLQECDSGVALGGGGGATMVTHLYSAMPGFTHRDPGMLGILLEAGKAAGAQQQGSLCGCPAAGAAVGAATRVPFPAGRAGAAKNGQLFYSVIADGCHVHARALCLAAKVHPLGLLLVTDSMRALGCPPGRYTYGDIDIQCHAGGGDGPYPKPHVVVAGTATLAGAVAPMDACLRNLHEALGCSVAAAVAAATSVPAAVLGLQGVLGAVVPGAWADLVLLDPASLSPVATYVAGKEAWATAAAPAAV